jgi:hypothetical protein
MDTEPTLGQNGKRRPTVLLFALFGLVIRYRYGSSISFEA